AEVTGCAAPEIDEFRFPSGDAGCARIHRQLGHAVFDVALDVLRIFIGVHAEVAEVAALPTERDMEIDAQRSLRRGGRFKHRAYAVVQLRAPERKWRVVGDEIIAGG